MVKKGLSRVQNYSFTGLAASGTASIDVEKLNSSSFLPDEAAFAVKGVSEYGIEYVDYLDETGKITAEDISGGSIQQSGAVPADNTNISRISLKYN